MGARAVSGPGMTRIVRVCAGVAVGVLAVMVVPVASARAQSAMPTAGSGWQPVQATCERQEFEAVVDEAAQTLRELTAKFTPEFQGKLRALKDKRGWSHDQFLAEATRFVRDRKISEYDDRSSQLLAEINSTGDGGGAKPDCAVLVKLRGSMSALVETQNAKWAYMFAQLDAELSK